MSQYPANEHAAVIRFAPASRERPGGAGSIVDNSGRAIVGLLEEAANLAQENTARAVGMAHRLSMELRAAEDRIRKLEADARLLEARAVRAEQWLVRIYGEIEEKFIRRASSRETRVAAE
jgi:hypothetical protein